MTTTNPLSGAEQPEDHLEAAPPSQPPAENASAPTLSILNPTPSEAGANAAPASPPIDPALTRSQGDKHLREIAKHELRLQQIARDAEEQMAEITAWAKDAAAPHEREIAYHKACIEPYARAQIDADPLRRKSTTFPAGTAGWRTPPARLVIDDEDAFCEWAQTYRPTWVRVEYAPRRDVVKKEGIAAGDRIKVDIEFTDGKVEREIVPGVRLVQAEPQFFVSTGAGGRR